MFATAPARCKTYAHPMDPRFTRFLTILIVFALGAAYAAPMPVAAQLSGSVSGLVLDGDGSPLAGADVVLKRQINGSLWSYHETKTQDDGVYAFKGLEQGTWTLVARLDGHRSNQTTVSVSLGGEAERDLTLVSLSERRYSGTVLDENEAPIQGAKITVFGYGGEDRTDRSTTSDAEGRFSIRLFAMENQIRIEKSGYGTYHDWVYQPSGMIERTIHMYPVPEQTALVTGKVVDADGAPVKAYIGLQPDWSGGCCIAYSDSADHYDAPAPEPMMARSGPPSYYYNNHNSTISADDGTFEMYAYEGDVIVQANRRGYLVASERVTLSDGQTTEITFTLHKLPERTVTLTGTVTNKQTGEPVQGASVSIQVPAAGDSHWVNTGADGKFSATVRPGYTIVEVDRWSWCCYDIAYAKAEPAMAPDSDMADDERAPGPGIREPAPHPPQDDTRYHPMTISFTTQANTERTLDVALSVKPTPPTTVIGYVVDTETGQAVAGARVSLQNHDTGEWGQATTDRNGSYKFTAYGGYHTARVWLEGYLPAALNVDIAASGTQRLDIEVRPGEHANEGWWSPDGDDDKYWGEPRPMPMPADGRTSSAPMESGASRDGMAFDSAESSVGARNDGPQTYSGSGGGLPPYDASKQGDTFGTEEAPFHPVFVLVLVIGLLAIAAGLRRQG